MPISKPTELLRASVSQEWREVLGRAEGPRKLTISTPASPTISAYLTNGNEENLEPSSLGLNRGYKGSQLAADTVLGPIEIQPNQRLFAIAESGVGHLTLTVEYPG